jgi:hypothetical protein
MKQECGLKAIRRLNATGHHYFIANLSPNDVSDRLPLAVPFKTAVWFNPLNGDITPASISGDSIDICLHSGESMILQTYDRPVANDRLQQAPKADETPTQKEIVLNGPWQLTFEASTPSISRAYSLSRLSPWEQLDDSTKTLMGTGIYTTQVKLSKKDCSEDHHWTIDLGDVRESARVYINNVFVGCAWSVPFTLDTRGTLKPGTNDIRIEVTNLPANRISHLDRQGVKWRKMEEINVVNIHYKKTLYDDWAPMPSGLNSDVKLILR